MRRNTILDGVEESKGHRDGHRYRGRIGEFPEQKRGEQAMNR